MTAITMIDIFIPPTGADAAPTASLLARRFPDAIVWFGTFTRQWWAMVPIAGRWRLIDGTGPDELTRAVIHARS